MRDYYEILGIRKNATNDEIKRAYRELALKYHPDRNKSDGATEKFKEINEAYAVLGDPEKRRQYDSFGPDQFNQRFSEEDIFRGFNTEEIFRDIFGAGGFGGQFGFGDMFGGMGQQPEQTGVNFYLSFDDLEKGVDREFEVRYNKACQACKGSGGEPGSKQVRCQACNGTGMRQVNQNTPFGRIQMASTCNRCGGRGKLYENLCRTCNGNGRVPVREKFRIKAERADKSEAKKRFWA